LAFYRVNITFTFIYERDELYKINSVGLSVFIFDTIVYFVN
jgi:hypothetical protein